ncbi:MAG: hypothetical protein HXS54_10495 [Theionarchaea archaeon]|nr:hypothetical protein [Theionarchaea archaeon]
MNEKTTSTNGGKGEETYKDDDLFEREIIDREKKTQNRYSLQYNYLIK